MRQPVKKPKAKAKTAAPTTLPAVANVKPKKGPGLPKHEPTQVTRNLVLLCGAMGQTQEQMARLIGISLPTLEKYYGPELADGGRKILTGIAGNLARIAQDPNHPKCVSAAIFWLKTKGGFRELDRPTAEEGGDEKVSFTINIGGSGGPPKPEPKVIDA